MKIKLDKLMDDISLRVDSMLRDKLYKILKYKDELTYNITDEEGYIDTEDIVFQITLRDFFGLNESDYQIDKLKDYLIAYDIYDPDYDNFGDEEDKEEAYEKLEEDENKVSPQKQKFIDYCKDKIQILGDVMLDDEEDIHYKIILHTPGIREFNNLYILVNFEDSNFNKLLAVNDTTYEKVIETSMIDYNQYAATLQFDIIDTEYYRTLIENWNDINMDEMIDIEEDNNEEKIEESNDLDLYPAIKNHVIEMIKKQDSTYDIIEYIEGQRRAYSIDKEEEQKLKDLIQKVKEHTIYECMDCGEEFEYDQVFIEDNYHNPSCPYCGSGDVAGLLDSDDKLEEDKEIKTEEIEFGKVYKSKSRNFPSRTIYFKTKEELDKFVKENNILTYYLHKFPEDYFSINYERKYDKNVNEKDKSKVISPENLKKQYIDQMKDVIYNFNRGTVPITIKKLLLNLDNDKRLKDTDIEEIKETIESLLNKEGFELEESVKKLNEVEEADKNKEKVTARNITKIIKNNTNFIVGKWGSQLMQNRQSRYGATEKIVVDGDFLTYSRWGSRAPFIVKLSPDIWIKDIKAKETIVDILNKNGLSSAKPYGRDVIIEQDYFDEDDNWENLEESKKYAIYATYGGDGVYNSKLVDTVDSEEQAADKVAELRATGVGASYEEIEDDKKELKLKDNVKKPYIKINELISEISEEVKRDYILNKELYKEFKDIELVDEKWKGNGRCIYIYFDEDEWKYSVSVSCTGHRKYFNKDQINEIAEFINTEIANYNKEQEKLNESFEADPKRLNRSVKEYYLANYPDEKDFVINMPEDITFKELYNRMLQGEDVYEILDIGDSVVRERIFDELADSMDVDYEVIYQTWLRSGNIRKKTEMKQGFTFDKYITIKTGFSDQKTEEILDSVVGQISDGIWENSRGMDRFWQWMDVYREGNEVVVKFNTSNFESGFKNKDEQQIRKWLANKIKQIVKEEGLEWDRNNTEKCDYLGYKAGVTVQDAYRVYDRILGRKDRITLDDNKDEDNEDEDKD